MSGKYQKILTVQTREISNGLRIFVNDKQFTISYPAAIWQNVPKNMRTILMENIAYAETNWLPLILKKDTVHYNTSRPLFEQLFFTNQIYDMLSCEILDNAPHLNYLRRFYNLDFQFNGATAALPNFNAEKKIKAKRPAQPTAIVPFTFGKESLTTLGLCMELGIKPVLFYCQEPAQPYEESRKREKLAELKRRFNIDYHFIKHEPGLFRYGRAFNLAQPTELGWGAQAGLLILLALPLVYKYNARYILMGNEASNNEREMKQNWRTEFSVDQTYFMTEAYNNMVRLLSAGRCEVKSSLEPLEEINIFHLLHHRYPGLASFQFSCSAEKPLYRKSQWCHSCYKCCRMYLFAMAMGLNPRVVGFEKNLLNNAKLWEHYFGKKRETGSMNELTFAFYALHRRGDSSQCTRLFAKKYLPGANAWRRHVKKYISMHRADNLPDAYRAKLISIFQEELKSFHTKLI